LQFDEASGHYRFGEIDWQEFNEVISGRGICNHERLAAKRKAWEEGEWVREAALAHAQKQRPQRGMRRDNMSKVYWPLYEVFVRSKQGYPIVTSAVCTPPMIKWRWKMPAMPTPAAAKAAQFGW
jgi:hypothetical protein